VSVPRRLLHVAAAVLGLGFLAAAPARAQDIRDVVREHLDRELEHKPAHPRRSDRPRSKHHHPRTHDHPTEPSAVPGPVTQAPPEPPPPAAPPLPQRVFEKYV